MLTESFQYIFLYPKINKSIQLVQKHGEAFNKLHTAQEKTKQLCLKERIWKICRTDTYFNNKYSEVKFICVDSNKNLNGQSAYGRWDTHHMLRFAVSKITNWQFHFMVLVQRCTTSPYRLPLTVVSNIWQKLWNGWSRRYYTCMIKKALLGSKQTFNS